MNANRRERLMPGAALLGGCVSPGLAWAVPPTPDPAVELTCGRAIGGHVRPTRGDTVRQFLGIPYGADTGPRRFLPPEPVASWTGAFNAAVHGPSSTQGSGGQEQRENCLVLNVWVFHTLPCFRIVMPSRSWHDLTFVGTTNWWIVRAFDVSGAPRSKGTAVSVEIFATS